MAALTPTLVVSLDASAGVYKKKIFTVVPQANGDTVDLSAYFDTIVSVKAWITGGLDANFTAVAPSFSGTDVTIVELEADGTAATNWTDGVIHLEVTGSDSAL